MLVQITKKCVQEQSTCIMVIVFGKYTLPLTKELTSPVETEWFSENGGHWTYILDVETLLVN